MKKGAETERPCPSAWRWVRGMVLATGLVWLVSWPFLPSINNYTEDPVVELNVFSPGEVIRRRSEGWGCTHFGHHGIAAIPDVTAMVGRKVAIWGDSFVAGYEVADEHKVAQQVTRLGKTENLLGVGLGRAGSSPADWYFWIPRYEKVVNPVCHVLVIWDPVLLQPDGVRFVDKPNYHFVERPAGAESSGMDRLRQHVEPWRLNFLWFAAHRVTQLARDSRFNVGEAKRVAPEAERYALRPSDHSVEAWRYAMRAFKQAATKRVVVVFAPSVPFIHHGQVHLDRIPPATARSGSLRLSEIHRELRAVCGEEGIGFVDVSDLFLAHYQQTGKFPHGFHNGVPSMGHWNEAGHQLVARAIVSHVLEDANGIYSN